MMPGFDVEKIRGDFPILQRRVRDQQLVYLDNAASTLKPVQVIERMNLYYRNETSNVHRGAHFLSEQGTVAYEGARATVAKFLNANDANEIIFTRGTTESVNLVASSFGERFLVGGDEIILSELEHHSNIVPWQLAAKKKDCRIKVIPIKSNGDLDFDAFSALLSAKTKIVSLTACSNALGTIVDVEKFIKAAHGAGAKIFIDAAQAIAQTPIDVQSLDCDFLGFFGHKIFGPYGIGVLFAKAELLEEMPPYQGGGSMISEVKWENTSWAAVPHKFEAGTPAISGALGLEAALEYVRTIGMTNIVKHEHDLLEYANQQLGCIPGLRIFGNPTRKAAILSFTVDGAHPSDLGALVDQQGVAIRAGHHCCQPLMRKLGVPATARASFSIYNTRADVDVLRAAVLKAKEIFT